MAIQVNIHEAKTSLSRLIEAVKRGEEVIIARAGTPEVRLVAVGPAGEKPKRRQFGAWKGKVWFAPDYDQADAEIEQDFHASPIIPEGGR
ncbi:MAG TPA: type II toxin-antitoxin system prevent-host-death family antitoxin [Ferrovibrio sp.]|uniref:type II toxin-antitoxin system Phd/YefM family antitoxin n=1 Tax=Ferrovibrio sp. TaxID=1917215 RepID=UPI002B4B24DD|nr:type II toxin-antitoxin system prevent-host-death family antitoxin [Ferrovibrio sp.]HLT76476.1 type II toxin-antitoxin system prevent-host-death family antitoxin [Ferrovibrio sp.]